MWLLANLEPRTWAGRILLAGMARFQGQSQLKREMTDLQMLGSEPLRKIVLKDCQNHLKSVWLFLRPVQELAYLVNTTAVTCRRHHLRVTNLSSRIRFLTQHSWREENLALSKTMSTMQGNHV